MGVSMQGPQQQQGKVFQELQQLGGHAAVQTVTDAPRGLKQTPLQGTEDAWDTFPRTLVCSRALNRSA